MFQNSKDYGGKIPGVHPNILCSPTKFCGEVIFYGMCKKDFKKQVMWKAILGHKYFFFCFLHTSQTMMFSLQTLCAKVGISRYTPVKFVRNF
jgi:hypothetical protein